MELIQYPPGGADMAARIAELENTAWPADGGAAFPTEPDTYVTSFVLMDGGVAVSHAAVRKTLLRHRGERYAAYGLSEVVTRPGCRGMGYAGRVVREAARFILSCRPDISAFTCAEDKAAFYARFGWKAAPGVCLTGGTPEKPLRSAGLGLVTMLMLVSPKSQAHSGDFKNAELVLPLGEGQLW